MSVHSIEYGGGIEYDIENISAALCSGQTPVNNNIESWRDSLNARSSLYARRARYMRHQESVISICSHKIQNE